MDSKMLEELIRKVVMEQMAGGANKGTNGVMSVKLPQIKLTEEDRFDVGDPNKKVYLRDVLTLEQSPRLGSGLLEIHHTSFPWTLCYDELNFVIAGHLDIIVNGNKVGADPGEIILIPKGSSVEYSAPSFARFLYTTYPADWAEQMNK